MIKLFTTIILISTFTSCTQRLTIEDVVITDRLFSPDSSYVALAYHKDNGAMGQSATMTSILKVNDTLEQINKYMLPCFDLSFYSCYFTDQWLDSNTLQVYLNERPFVKEGIPFNSENFTLNGINCKVVSYDYSYYSDPLIEYFRFSDDRKKLIVAYRYRGDLNISAIAYGQKLPRIGNIFTNTEISFNPIKYVDWDGIGINMYLYDAENYNTSDYINKNVESRVNFVDVAQLKGKYRINDYLDHIPLCDDTETNNFLKEHGMPTKALITETQWRMDGDRSLFYFEYEYEAASQKYRSYFRIYKPYKNGADYVKGDTIAIDYDPIQPLIHKTQKNYGRHYLAKRTEKRLQN